MKYNYKLGIIGAGNMSYAIVKGVLSSNFIDATNILVSDASVDALKKITTSTTNDNLKVLKECEFVILAIKPQIFNQIKEEFLGNVEARVVLSIMAGISSASIARILDKTKVVRIMPNTPCMVAEGMSAVQDTELLGQDKDFISGIFKTIGKVVFIGEEKFDAVTAVSGSGPAYIYTFIKAMSEAGVKFGLTSDESKTLTLQTFRGALEMVEKNCDTSIDKLIDAVCSKGGTTIEAVDHFNSENLIKIIQDGMEKCKNKSVLLGKSNK